MDQCFFSSKQLWTRNAFHALFILYIVFGSALPFSTYNGVPVYTTSVLTFFQNRFQMDYFYVFGFRIINLCSKKNIYMSIHWWNEFITIDKKCCFALDNIRVFIRSVTGQKRNLWGNNTFECSHGHRDVKINIRQAMFCGFLRR